MKHDKDTRLLLANIFGHLKTQQAAISVVMSEVASLRDVLKKASPKFSELFSERLKYWRAQTAALNAESAAEFDAMIRKVRER